MAKNFGARMASGVAIGPGTTVLVEERFTPRVEWRFDPAATGAHPVVNDDARFVGGARPPELSPEQLGAYRRLLAYARGDCAAPASRDGPVPLAGRVAILTGIAGSGKTTVVSWLRAAHPGLFTVCATTGSAALLAGGCTIDRLFGFSRDTWEVSPRLVTAAMRICNQCVIIDEASMVGAGMAAAVTAALQLYPDKRVILVGDWAQSAPVKDDWPFNAALFREAELVRLTGCHRQDDSEYLAALQELRAGGGIPAYFRRCEVRAEPDDDTCVHAYAVNRAVDRRNFDRYARLRAADPEAPEWRLDCRVVRRQWDVNRYVMQKSLLSEVAERRLIDDSRLADRMPVCPGARVIATRNSGKGMAYVNGDSGSVVEYDVKTDSVVVRLDRTGQPVSVGRITVAKSPPAADADHAVIGFPLRYGWAVTIHRMQGMTLPRVYVELASLRKMPPDGRHGLAYVALSRTSSIAGLSIDDAGVDVAVSDPAVAGLI